MVLSKSIKALTDLFLHGACNEIKVLLPYPENEVSDALVAEGWIKTNDSHGNTVFIPHDADDKFDMRSWAATSCDCEDETTIQFGHL